MKRRYYNIFQEDGKAVVLAFDHGRDGREMGVDEGEVLRAARRGGADAVLVSYGTAKYHKADIGSMGLIVRLDTTPSAIGRDKEKNVPDISYQVEDMARFGADACIVMGFPSGDFDYEMTRLVAHVVTECDKYGILSAAEMLPNGFSSDPADRTLEKMGIALRNGSALGCDFIKTDYAGTPEEYKSIVDTCAAPVLVLGNGKTDEKTFLQTIRNAMDAGCKGLICGKNIWQCKDIEGMIRALNKIVHEDASVEEAIKEIHL